MGLTEKVTHADLVLYEVTRHPILCGEFYRTLDIPEWSDDEFHYHDYQREYLGDFNRFVSLCCARAVGKTWALSDFIIWLLINNVFRNDYIVYTVPNKVHLEPVFTTLTRAFRNNDLLKHFIEPRRGINASNHTIKLMNASELLCRIAGTSGGGQNVVGLHSPVIILDEAGYYPWNTWQELQPVLNTWQDGFKLFVSGVPTGLRENNVLYYADEGDDTYSHHRTSAHENPLYSDEDEERNLHKYNGADSEDYIHFVLGRHGSPTFAVFDRRLMEIKPYPTYRIKFSGIDITDTIDMRNRLAILPSVPADAELTLMGIDLGYTEPTSIVVLYEKKGQIFEHARIEMVKVQYPIQEKLINFLDTKFNQPSIIGVDSGGPGKGLVQHLLQDDDYVHKNFEKRLVPIEFGSWLSLGIDTEGNDIKVKTKPYSVTLLQEYSNSHKIVYSSTDLDLITELERMTYTKTPTGDITYRTLTPRGGQRGDDHNTAAMLAGMMAYFLKREHRLLFKPKKPLLKPKWVSVEL